MYGLWDDSVTQDMPWPFESSSLMWQAVARNMKATYKLWNAHELESLVFQKYPQYWDMYKNVPCAIMRVHIGRLIVLHHYGGMYSDLDIKPNRSWYIQSDIDVGHKQSMLHASDTEEDFSGKERKIINGYTSSIIVGSQGNPIFLMWLDHMKWQINSQRSWIAKRYRVKYTTGDVTTKRVLNMNMDPAQRSPTKPKPG